MADTVDSVTLNDGPRNVVIRRTNVSDGTGESDAVAVDISTLSSDPILGAPTHLVIERVEYDIQGFTSVRLEFDATTDDEALVLGKGQGCIDLKKYGGITDPKTTGTTGDILVTTAGNAANNTYTLVIHCRKKFA